MQGDLGAPLPSFCPSQHFLFALCRRVKVCEGPIPFTAYGERAAPLGHAIQRRVTSVYLTTQTLSSIAWR